VRLASRMVGVVLVFAGLVFLGLFVFLAFNFRPDSVLEAPMFFGRPVWTGELFGVVLGIGLILAGWHFLRLDVDGLDEVEGRPTSRFAPFLLAHRRELKVIAQIGLVISLVRLGAVGFGHDWPAWPLVLTWIGLVVIGSRIAKLRTIDLNWQTVPERLRPALKAVVKALKLAFLISLLVLAWNQFSHHRVGAQFVRAAFIALMFAWESLFFAYGEVRTDLELVTNRLAPPPARL